MDVLLLVACAGLAVTGTLLIACAALFYYGPTARDGDTPDTE